MIMRSAAPAHAVEQLVSGKLSLTAAVRTTAGFPQGPGPKPAVNVSLRLSALAALPSAPQEPHDAYTRVRDGASKTAKWPQQSTAELCLCNT